MRITKETPIHYFIKDRSNDTWHNLEMESYLEIPQRNGTSKFSRLEGVSLFMSKDQENHEVISFHYDGGRNDCMGHWAKKKQELVKEKESDADIYRFTSTDRETYLKLREEVFKIYLTHPKTDFERLK